MSFSLSFSKIIVPFLDILSVVVINIYWNSLELDIDIERKVFDSATKAILYGFLFYRSDWIEWKLLSKLYAHQSLYCGCCCCFILFLSFELKSRAIFIWYTFMLNIMYIVFNIAYKLHILNALRHFAQYTVCNVIMDTLITYN